MKRSLNNYSKPKTSSSGRKRRFLTLQKQTKESSLEVSSDFSVNEHEPNSIRAKAGKRKTEVIKVNKEKKHQKYRSYKSGRYGRWTEAEHKKLMEALDLYGNTWSQVEKYLGTRTRGQIRSHVQKYFLRVKKSLISEMAQKGELEKKVFVITHEYRNNTRATLEACNTIKKIELNINKSSKDPSKPADSIKNSETEEVAKISELEAQLGPNEFFSPINPNLEMMWRIAGENEEKILGRNCEIGLSIYPDPFENERIEIMNLEKSEELDAFGIEAGKIEYKDEDSVLLI